MTDKDFQHLGNFWSSNQKKENPVEPVKNSEQYVQNFVSYFANKQMLGKHLCIPRFGTNVRADDRLG